MKKKREKAVLVDRISRWLFPTSFILLNIVYWALFGDHDLWWSVRHPAKQTNNKMESNKTEGLSEKIKILQNTLETYSNKSNEKETKINSLNHQLSEMKNEYSILKTKYTSLQDEMEIYNKNVKKNFSLEVTVKELAKENEKCIRL